MSVACHYTNLTNALYLNKLNVDTIFIKKFALASTLLIDQRIERGYHLYQKCALNSLY